MRAFNFETMTIDNCMCSYDEEDEKKDYPSIIYDIIRIKNHNTYVLNKNEIYDIKKNFFISVNITAITKITQLDNNITEITFDDNFHIKINTNYSSRYMNIINANF